MLQARAHRNRAAHRAEHVEHVTGDRQPGRRQLDGEAARTYINRQPQFAQIGFPAHLLVGTHQQPLSRFELHQGGFDSQIGLNQVCRDLADTFDESLTCTHGAKPTLSEEDVQGEIRRKRRSGISLCALGVSAVQCCIFTRRIHSSDGSQARQAASRSAKDKPSAL
ncbi:MAG: hypothetical protein KatS3mg051_1684 [Anaerolineae bacterium]|nr:MAG: hypothetical protein KatS3mg051_1684 [Anaerolineae bacterium]